MTTNLLNPACDTCYDCDDCPVEWTFHDCRLYWKLTTPPGVDYGITITGPGGYSVSYTNQPNGMVDTPASGTWTAAYSIVGSGDPAIECDIAITGCTPTYDCCINTVGIHGVVSGLAASDIVPVTTTIGAPPGYYKFQAMGIFEFADANCAWYRLKEMVFPGVKTPTICYDRLITGRVLIGTATQREYTISYGSDFDPAVKPISSLVEADAQAELNYWLRDSDADLYLDFNTPGSFSIVAKVTASSVTQVGSPLGTVSAFTVGSESDLVGVNAATSNKFHYGECAVYSGKRILKPIGGAGYPIGGRDPDYISWPEVSP